jgi:hypothetical protein
LDSDHQGLFPIRPTVTIAITPAAFAAIEATPPTGSQAATRPDGKAGYLVTLQHSVIEGHARPGGDTPEAHRADSPSEDIQDRSGSGSMRWSTESRLTSQW